MLHTEGLSRIRAYRRLSYRASLTIQSREKIPLRGFFPLYQALGPTDNASTSQPSSRSGGGSKRNCRASAFGMHLLWRPLVSRHGRRRTDGATSRVGILPPNHRYSVHCLRSSHFVGLCTFGSRCYWQAALVALWPRRDHSRLPDSGIWVHTANVRNPRTVLAFLAVELRNLRRLWRRTCGRLVAVLGPPHSGTALTIQSKGTKIVPILLP